MTSNGYANKDNPISMVDPINASPTPSAADSNMSLSCGKRKKSYKSHYSVWDHFTKVEKNYGSKTDKATCDYCGKEFGCASSQGISTLHRHLEKCWKYPYGSGDKNKKMLSFSTSDGGSGDSVTSLPSYKFDYELFRKELCRMIIVDGLPFRFVERPGFHSFCRALNPLFTPISHTTLTKDCIALYLSERKKLKDLFQDPTQRVCISTDMWTSIQNLGYMCITAHYIDKEWNLQKKIINFCVVPSPHSGEVIANVVEECLLEWGLEKLCTVTVDNCSLNDVAIRNLRRKFNKRNGLLLDGEFLHMRCCAHILNLIVTDVVEEAKDSVLRIRNAVKYVRSSPSRSQLFKKCVEQEEIPCKKVLCLDVCTLWNSTFLMLQTALEFQKAFECLENQDFNYQKELKDGSPNEKDWRTAKVLCMFLERFYSCAKHLLGSLYVTSDAYFHEVYRIELFLMQWSKNEDDMVRELAMKMKKNFDKYWGNIDRNNIMLLVAVALDPRFKFKYLQFCYSKIYPINDVDQLVEKVKTTLERLLKNYQTLQPSISAVETVVDSDDFMKSIHDEFQRYLEEVKGLETRSELDYYLLERVELNDSFNVLYWWKVNAVRFPILSQIARDVLAIPASTVASESAFSTGGPVLGPFRSSLTPKLVEMSICAQDWLRYPSTPIEIEENLEELEELESVVTMDIED